MSLGSRIRQLRLEKGYSQGDLAKMVGVERSYISHIESGKTDMPTKMVLVSLANALDTTMEDLLTAAGYLTPSVVRRARERQRRTQELLRELELATPILLEEYSGRVSAGAGAPYEGELWPYYPTMGERSHDFIAVPVSGSCMEPRIPEGSRVVVDRTESPRPGDTVVAAHDDELLVKRLERRNGDLYLVALKEREPIRVTEQTTILGVVKMVMLRP
jgi:transcriptional regulator with XRE-family HTH domain